MNKDKIREIRDSWGNSTSIYELCNALLEDGVDEVMPAPNVVPLPGAVFNIKATSSDEPNVEEPKQLLPCPACGGEAVLCGDGNRWRCSNSDCCIWGPIDDRTGSRWNALPRRGGLFSERMVQVACKDRENAVNDRWIDAVRRSSCIEQLCAKMGVTDE